MKQDRTKFIGGSDAASILGLSRWKTPLQLWAEKTGNILQPDISNQIPIRFGNKLEQAVSEFFTEETGKKVHKVNEVLIHPIYDFIRANIDRKVVGEKALLECKTCTPFKYKEWLGEEIPIEYIMQCYHYLSVTGYERVYLAVLIGNQDFKYKVIERDENIINDLIAKEVNFWTNFVLTKQMPFNMVNASDNETIRSLYPDAIPDTLLELGDDVNSIIELLESLKQDETQVENRIAQKQNELKLLLKDNEQAETNLYKITYKNQSRNNIDIKKLSAEEPSIYKKYVTVSKFRTLRYKKKEMEKDEN